MIKSISNAFGVDLCISRLFTVALVTLLLFAIAPVSKAQFSSQLLLPRRGYGYDWRGGRKKGLRSR